MNFKEHWNTFVRKHNKESCLWVVQGFANLTLMFTLFWDRLLWAAARCCIWDISWGVGETWPNRPKPWVLEWPRHEVPRCCGSPEDESLVNGCFFNSLIEQSSSLKDLCLVKKCLEQVQQGTEILETKLNLKSIFLNFASPYSSFLPELYYIDLKI